jgi:hypothetical protein
MFAPMCDYLTLCKSAILIQRQGLLNAFDNAPEKLTADEIEAQSVAADTSYGTLRTLGPALNMSETPRRWDRPTPKPGGDAPERLPR